MRQRECSFYGWIHDQENGESEKMVKKKKKKSSKESRKQCIVVDVPIIMLYPGRLSLHFIQYGRGYARIHRCKSRLWKRREK